MTYSRIILVSLVLLFSKVSAYDLVENDHRKGKTYTQIELGSSYLLGDTRYDTGFGWDFYGNLYKGKSELTFPVDGPVFTAAFTLKYYTQKVKRHCVFVKFGKNLLDPIEKMYDKDWITASWLDVYNRLFSSTESDAEMSAYIFDIRYMAEFLNKTPLHFDIGIGYNYQNCDYDIYGIEGWQLYDPINNPEEVYYIDPADNAGENVLDYEITYSAFYGAIGIRYVPLEWLQFDFLGKVSPFAKAKDEDIHILRSLTVDAELEGNWYEYGLQISLLTKRRFLSGNFFTTLCLKGTKFSGSGTRHHEYYGDDPGTPDSDETGDEGESLTNIYMSQGQISLTLGLEI